MNAKMLFSRAPSAARLAMTVVPKAMEVSHAYWLAMFAASVLGTNLGDLCADMLFSSRFTSLASLLGICAIAVWYDRRAAPYSEAGYWVAIVVMRAAATNLADIFTHDLAFGYVLPAVLLLVLTLIAAHFTSPDPARSASPRVNGPYWVAMFIAGLFGTVAGDRIHHGIGLYAASTMLCCVLVGLIVSRDKRAAASTLLYWSIVMIERCAGTAVGDTLASHRAVALGVPLASVCSGMFLAISLLMRTQFRQWTGPGTAR